MGMHFMIRASLAAFVAFSLLAVSPAAAQTINVPVAQRWPAAKAWKWYRAQP